MSVTVNTRPQTLDTVRNIRLGSKWMTASVDADVSDIGRRLHEGDPTVGWLGDDTLEIRLAVEVDSKDRPTGGESHFVVMGRDQRGNEYICLRWPRCDVSMLRALAERDTRTQNMVAIYEQHARKAEAEKAEKIRQQFEEIGDKAQWALRRDIGHLEGGTHRHTAIDGFKKEKAVEPAGA